MWKRAPVHSASLCLNSVEKNYSRCESKSLTVVFSLKKIQIYLLSSENLDLYTYHQEIRYEFQLKYIHGTPSGCLTLFEKYQL